MLSCPLHSVVWTFSVLQVFPTKSSHSSSFWVTSFRYFCSINVFYNTEWISTENFDQYLSFLPMLVIWPARLIRPYSITLALSNTEHKSWHFLRCNLLQPPDTCYTFHPNGLLKLPQSMFLSQWNRTYQHPCMFKLNYKSRDVFLVNNVIFHGCIFKNRWLNCFSSYY